MHVSSLNTAGLLTWEGGIWAQHHMAWICLTVILGLIINQGNNTLFLSITQLYCCFRKHWKAKHITFALKNGKVCFTEQNYGYVWSTELDGQHGGAGRKALPGRTSWGSCRTHSQKEISSQPLPAGSSDSCGPESQGQKWGSESQNTGSTALCVLRGSKSPSDLT